MMSVYEHFRRIAEDPQSVEKHLEAAAEDSRNSHADADADAKSLMRFLVEAAAEGSIERYRLIWPDLIKDAEANSNRDYNDPKPRRGERAMLVWACQCAVEASFAVALVRGFDKIVQHVLYHFKNPFYGWKPGKTASELGAEDFRSKTPSMLLRHAAAYAGKDLVAHILRDEDCVKPKELEAAIYAAAGADRLDTVEMIVAHLMTLEKGEPRCLWGSVKVGRYATLDEQRLEVVGMSLSMWPSKTIVQGQRILLGLFFQLVHAVYIATPDCEDVIAIKRALDEEWALLLSRDQCFKILGIGMPPKIKASIFKNLRIIDRAMPPDSILIKTDGEPFVAQRDLLCYWSRYFAGLSRHAWVDGAAVDFGYHIHPVVMKSVLNFMYCGEYVDINCADKNEFLTQLWEAADYLQIDLLKEKVGLLLDQFEEEEL